MLEYCPPSLLGDPLVGEKSAFHVKKFDRPRQERVV